MKLYVWENVLCDYTCGVMFALANSVEEARKLIEDSSPGLELSEDLMKEPDVYDAPEGFVVMGGG